MLTLRLDPKNAKDMAWQPLPRETPEKYFERCERFFAVLSDDFALN